MAPGKRKSAAGSTSPAATSSRVEADEQIFNKDGTRRKSRVLRRKTDHSIIERRRREKINEKLVALQNIVPACRKECQDLIERKFTTPLRATDDKEADNTSNVNANANASKRDAKRKREEDRFDKAKNEMSEKVRTSMVLEKLCIISHTLDFVVKLQEENKALRALCDCQAERRASININVELEEHYRSAHSFDTAVEEGMEQEDIKQSVLSPSGSSDPDSVMQEEQVKPNKRRLHWGSDDVREASIRHDTCRHKCGVHAHHEAYSRERSLSLTASEPDFDTFNESKCSTTSASRELCRTSLACSASSSDSAPCSSFCRTRHSCCREEEQASEPSSDASDDPTSSPPCQLKWPVIAANGHTGYLGRQRLPPIVHLGLPKHDSHLASIRQDTFASLYRRDLPKAAEPAASRPFRPLSLYTSHVPPPTLSRVKP